MVSTLEKEQVVLWKGKTLTLKGFTNMIPNMTKTDVDLFLDNKELVKLTSDYLKKNPKDRRKSNGKA